MNIRPLDINQYDEAVALSLSVFTKCGGEDFDTNGLESFKRFVSNKELVNTLILFGAFEYDKLIGIVGTKNSGSHISLFFVDPLFHRKGVGRKLFEFAYLHKPVTEITVNSSSYAICFYESLGFVKMADKQETDGLEYTPMIRYSIYKAADSDV